MLIHRTKKKNQIIKYMIRNVKGILCRSIDPNDPQPMEYHLQPKKRKYDVQILKQNNTVNFGKIMNISQLHKNQIVWCISKDIYAKIIEIYHSSIQIAIYPHYNEYEVVEIKDIYV